MLAGCRVLIRFARWSVVDRHRHDHHYNQRMLETMLDLLQL